MLKTVEGFYRDGQEDIALLCPCRLLILLETILGIQQGFDEVNAGKTRPLGDFVREMEQKYEICELR